MQDIHNHPGFKFPLTSWQAGSALIHVRTDCLIVLCGQ
ncbi:hypothetical protein GALL_372390 [mine drainage metagenome]|uniref:Uncharacterized protein n=1 Tax=mine drainage metagenome TaxID=410659 RepID=A0A1J5QYL3_9ZZZZ